MTASVDPQETYDVTVLDSAAPLLNMLRTVNDRITPVAGAIVWWLYAGEHARDKLIVGVRGDVGSLMWVGDGELFVPVGGLNTDEVDYFTYDGHHFVQPVGSEVPIELAYRVVEEFVATRRRPTSVEWELDRSGENVEQQPPPAPGETWP